MYTYGSKEIELIRKHVIKHGLVNKWELTQDDVTILGNSLLEDNNETIGFKIVSMRKESVNELLECIILTKHSGLLN